MVPRVSSRSAASQSHIGYIGAGSSTLVFKNVPARVCNNCGEGFVAERTTKKLQTLAGRAAAQGVLFQLRLFPARRRESRDFYGLWADQGVHITDQDLKRARSGLWGNFPRDIKQDGDQHALEKTDHR